MTVRLSCLLFKSKKKAETVDFKEELKNLKKEKSKMVEDQSKTR